MDNPIRGKRRGQKRRLPSVLIRGGCQYCRKAEASSAQEIISQAAENADGQNDLHILCQDRNAALCCARMLIGAHPELLERKDVYGRLPLFYALKRACSIEVVTTIFDGFPGAITVKDFCGDSPLHLLYHSSKDYSILKYVLSKNPELALHKENNGFGPTLVKTICAPWTLGEVVSCTTVESNAVLKDRWTKLVLTVRAAHTCTAGLGRSAETPELHLALEFLCPPLVICHFLEMYPKQASLLMSNQQCFPLHHFLCRAIAIYDGQAVIRSLLKAFPRASVERYNGRLPIHLALAAGLTWLTGVSDIVFADSGVLGEIDPVDSLFPFMQAAACKRCDMSTIYSLLRENPAVLNTLQR